MSEERFPWASAAEVWAAFTALGLLLGIAYVILRT